MEIDWRATGVTVSVVLPEIVADVALMIEEPVLTVVARPVALTVATVGVAELQKR